MSNQIKNIIFDLGGVLIDWQPLNLYKKIFDDQEEARKFLQQVCHQEWNELQDAGRPFAQAIEEKVMQFPQYENQIKAYFERWEEMLVGPINSTVELLQRLKSENKCRLFALSNWSAETFPIAERKYSFLQLFEAKVISGKIGLKKPDPKIYHYLLDNHALKADECFFIDDSLRNIESSTSLGITSHHYKSSKELLNCLREIGFLGQ